MKLVLITLAASVVGAVVVTASNAADRPAPLHMPDRAELVQTVDASPGTSRPDFAACGHGRRGPDDRGPRGRGPDDRGPGDRAGPLPDDLSGPRPPFPPGHGPLMLASRLSAIETLIGIKGDQLGTWRGYTDALQAAIAPPPPSDADGPPPSLDVLSQSAELARRGVEQGKLAAALLSALDALRGTLSPAQLERLKTAGPLLPPHPAGPPPGGPPSSNFPASFGPPGPGGPGSGLIPPP